MMKKSMVVWAATLLVAMSVQASLISNGNFDADIIPAGTQTNTVTSWTTTASAPVYNPDSSSLLQPYSEENLMYVGNTQGMVAAKQAISLVEGMQYRITARVRNFPGSAYVNYFFVVQDTAGSTNIFGVSDRFNTGIWTGGPSGNTDTWTLVESAWYTATEADETEGRILSIGTYDGTADDKYVCVDNIDIEAVPEPATLAFLIGSGVLALIRRRK